MAENLENQNTQANAEPTAEELSEVLRVRREKLTALQQAGNDPFAQTRFDRTVYAQQIAEQFAQLEPDAGRINEVRHRDAPFKTS